MTVIHFKPIFRLKTTNMHQIVFYYFHSSENTIVTVRQWASIVSAPLAETMLLAVAHCIDQASAHSPRKKSSKTKVKHFLLILD